MAVGEADHNPTTRHANFMVWSDAAGKGMPIPATMLVDMSDLPNKELAKEQIQEEIDRQRALQESKQQTEIQKTVIAKGGAGQ